MSALSLQASEACPLEITQVLLRANAKPDQGICTWTVHVLCYRPVKPRPFFLSVYSSPFVFTSQDLLGYFEDLCVITASMCLGSLHGLHYFVPSLYIPASLKTLMTPTPPKEEHHLLCSHGWEAGKCGRNCAPFFLSPHDVSDWWV